MMELWLRTHMMPTLTRILANFSGNIITYLTEWKILERGWAIMQAKWVLTDFKLIILPTPLLLYLK